ncbi:MAG TPA: hypothetical protein VFN10_22165 [Thermoanaerobaculia bacterium]|nr:hypothetical protein [Thermoanaerobaculia bacterium]
MSEDRFFERLRNDAAPLRYEPEPFAMTRLSARIRERIETPPTIAGLLAAWFRPLGAALAAVALAATIGITVANNRAEEVAVGNAYSSTNVDVSVAGDSYRVAD